MNKKIIYLIGIVFLLFLVLIFGPIITNYDKTANNTYLLDKNYSNLSRDQIISQIDKDFSLPSKFVLVSPDKKEFDFSLASVSAQIDKNKTASTMLFRRLNQGFFAYIKYFFKPKTFNLDISYDTNRLNDQIKNLSSQINKPFIPAEIIFKNNTFSTTPASLGLELDQDDLSNQLITQLISGKFDQKINLKTKIVGFIPNDNQISGAKSRAEKLSKKTINLVQGFNNIPISSNTIISWIGFQSNYQQSKIDDYVKNISASINRESSDAVFKFENNKVIEFHPAQNGIKVKESELSNSIINSLDQLLVSTDSSKKIEIPIESTEPKIKNEEVNSLGIKELIGRGTSSFSHSSATRNMNVEKGSSIINRILVSPNETFSFIKNLGEVSLEAGYKKAYIIREGKTELDVGGGICQVSTTLFRAILDAGLNITERQAHAYRVSYYEEDSKPGFDATVFIPNPDLEFINDTGHYLLIQSTYDGKNKKLTYEIYGTNDGRKTEISNYKQWGAQAAPPDVWIDDPTLPVGQVVQDEHKIPGLKTAFDWTVRDKNGTIIHQKTFQSSYVPWAAVYRRGTKI